VRNSIIIKETYGKSSDAVFTAKGHCKALFRGPENSEEKVNAVKASLGKNNIRVFDIILYNEIEITDTILIEDWNQESNNYNHLPQFTVQFENEAAIHFAKIEWENVDFMRSEIEKGIFINPKIIYSYQKEGYTFGEIEGDLLFKIYNPKPEIKPIIPEITPIRIVTTKKIIKNTFEPLLPVGLSSSDLSAMQNAGCFWSVFRFFTLLLLALLLINGCSKFSSQAWKQERENTIQNDSTLRIPDGDEIEYKDRNKNFIINADTTIIVPPGNYKLFIRDHGSKVDHDKINLFVNGQIVKRDMEIFRKPTEIPMANLRYGENQIDFAVISQGLEGNCTAKIIIVNTNENKISARLKINNIVNHISRLKLIQR
jgi:hypothetical protein